MSAALAPPPLSDCLLEVLFSSGGRPGPFRYLITRVSSLILIVVRTLAKHYSPDSRRAFALIELPLVICLLLALVGIIIGALLWYRSGTVTAEAWVGFSLVLPLSALLAFLLCGAWRHRGRGE
jgi:ABC-type uncharacterized transport system YnjBCD permease subunit